MDNCLIDINELSRRLSIAKGDFATLIWPTCARLIWPILTH
jgi:hypothetical protein